MYSLVETLKQSSKKRNLKIELSLNYQKRVQTVEFKRIFLDLVEDKKENEINQYHKGRTERLVVS